MAYPHEYWLKYMLAYVEASIEEVQTASELYGLGVPTKEELTSIRKNLKKTRPSPFRENSVKVKNWIRRQRFMSMVNKGKYLVEARNILGDRRLRHVVQALVIADLEADAIAVYCKEITGKTLHKKSIKLFKHYFWNAATLSLPEWSEYLKDSPYKDFYLNCRERGEDYTLWKLGYRIEKTDNELVTTMLHEAQARFFETTSDDNTKDTAMKAKLWSEVVFKALEEKNKSGDAVKQVLDELKSISIHLQKDDIPSIGELSGGRHSKKKLETKSEE